MVKNCILEKITTMIVQIYSITTPEQALKLCKLGVDHVGVMTGKVSGTYTQDFESTKRIFESITLPVKKVAFTKSNTLSELEEICRETKPDILHISAFENVTKDLLNKLKLEFSNIQLMKSIYVKDSNSIIEAKHFQDLVDFILLDSQNDSSSFGATGKVTDWKLARKIVEAVQILVILAGGLGTDNVVKAIKTVQPAGVDSMTKTNLKDSKFKDMDKVSEFVKLAKSSGC